jgi:hypothetical protein
MRTQEPTITFEHGTPHDDVRITMPWNADAVRVIKGLPPGSRRWDKTERCWYCHPGYATGLATALRRLGFPIIGMDVTV